MKSLIGVNFNFQDFYSSYLNAGYPLSELTNQYGYLGTATLNNVRTSDAHTEPVPEPTTIIMMLMSVFGLFGIKRIIKV